MLFTHFLLLICYNQHITSNTLLHVTDSPCNICATKHAVVFVLLDLFLLSTPLIDFHLSFEEKPIFLLFFFFGYALEFLNAILSNYNFIFEITLNGTTLQLFSKLNISSVTLDSNMDYTLFIFQTIQVFNFYIEAIKRVQQFIYL